MCQAGGDPFGGSRAFDGFWSMMPAIHGGGLFVGQTCVSGQVDGVGLPVEPRGVAGDGERQAHLPAGEVVFAGKKEASVGCLGIGGQVPDRTGDAREGAGTKHEVIGDEEANRLVYQPMRAPWRL